jgi:uncharacterized protein YjbJ (UPF0337 family)
MPDRLDEAKGSVKEGVGKLVGNERMQTEGATERTTAKAARESKGAAKQAAGNLKMAAGKLVGNERLHAEGQAQDTEGAVQRAG